MKIRGVLAIPYYMSWVIIMHEHYKTMSKMLFHVWQQWFMQDINILCHIHDPFETIVFCQLQLLRCILRSYYLIYHVSLFFTNILFSLPHCSLTMPSEPFSGYIHHHRILSCCILSHLTRLTSYLSLAFMDDLILASDSHYHFIKLLDDIAYSSVMQMKVFSYFSRIIPIFDKIIMDIFASSKIYFLLSISTSTCQMCSFKARQG